MKLSKILPIIGLLIFTYLIYKIGLTEIIQAFTITNYTYFIIAIITVLFVIFFQTYKWNLILKIQKYKIPFKTILKIQLISIFYGFITPARAGSIIRSKYLNEITGKSLVNASSNTIIERILDIASILLLTMIGILLFLNYFSGMINAILAFTLIFAIAAIIFTNKSNTKKFLRFFYEFLLPKKYKLKAREYFYEFYKEMPKKRKLSYPFITCLITWILIYSVSYFVALSIGISLPYYYFITLYPISTLLGMLPISPSGLGVREATLVGIFTTFGIASNQIVAMSLISVILANAIPSVIGFILSLKKES